MKILAIGNSFSEDATAYLYKIAKSANTDMYVVNLFIGGCSLERHANNLRADAKEYAKFVNTAYVDGKVSIKESLLLEKWDAVTIQQVSTHSGFIESYEPYAGELLSAIREYAPSAKIYFHQTWAYEMGDTRPAFVSNYDGSQAKMTEKILEASEMFSEKNGLTVIPSGRVIDALRRTAPFDYKNGGLSLCRDGAHISLDYGRYALGAVWFKTLAGGNIFDSDFAPEGTDKEKINLIKTVVSSI